MSIIKFFQRNLNLGIEVSTRIYVLKNNLKRFHIPEPHDTFGKRHKSSIRELELNLDEKIQKKNRVLHSIQNALEGHQAHSSSSSNLFAQSTPSHHRNVNECEPSASIDLRDGISHGFSNGNTPISSQSSIFQSVLTSRNMD